MHTGSDTEPRLKQAFDSLSSADACTHPHLCPRGGPEQKVPLDTVNKCIGSGAHIWSQTRQNKHQWRTKLSSHGHGGALLSQDDQPHFAE